MNNFTYTHHVQLLFTHATGASHGDNGGFKEHGRPWSRDFLGGALSEHGHYIVHPFSTARSSLCPPGLPLGRSVIASLMTGDGKWICTEALPSKHVHSFRWCRLVRRSQDWVMGERVLRAEMFVLTLRRWLDCSHQVTVFGYPLW